ncbi:MAG: branched-chain amino acid ABC transporter permease [Synergistaceae bacterium]|jgi:branched-chain amino acid transport system permease protein|nr:branched-chain amino acid ABC transporter permease [Synergistaceae bacterium]
MQGLKILLQPNVFMQLTINGVAMGMIYTLMAMGLILLIRAIGVMNFAQGELLMLGAFITWGLTYQVKLPFVLMVPAAMLCFALVGVIFMFVVYWPLRTASYPTATVISTMGAAMVIREIATITWGSLPLVSAPLIKGVIRVGSLRLQYQYLLTIVIGAVLIFLVFVLFEKLYAGKIMQAAAQDKYAAELLGIPTILTTAVTYIIVVTLASIGGYMIAPVFLVNVTLGTLQLRAFAGVVTGGFGSVKGAIVGSLVIGLVESYSSTFTTTYKDAVVFLVLIVVLLFRPQGLFGERVADKA